MTISTPNHVKRWAGALSAAFVVAIAAGCSSLDDTIGAVSAPANTSSLGSEPSEADSSTTTAASTTTETSTSAETTTTGSTTPEASTREQLANGSTPGTSAVTCPGEFLGYGVTSGFEFALCDTEKDRALFRRINLRNGDLVEGSACLGDKIWSAYIRGWRYDIDLVPETPELVIVDNNRQLFLREAMSDSIWLTDDWESHYFC